MIFEDFYEQPCTHYMYWPLELVEGEYIPDDVCEDCGANLKGYNVKHIRELVNE